MENPARGFPRALACGFFRRPLPFTRLSGGTAKLLQTDIHNERA